MFDQKEYTKAYNKKHRESHNQKAREYYHKNKEVIKAKKQTDEYKKEASRKEKELRKKNPEKFRNKEKRYRSKNPIKYTLIDIKKRSKKNNILFSLEENHIIVNTICPLLEIPIKKYDGYKHDNSPSIDRIYPQLGYVPNNILYISNKANSIKNNLTIEEIELLNQNYFNVGAMLNDNIENYKTKRNNLYSWAKRRAKIKNIKFEIDKEDIIIPQKCPLLNIDICLTNTVVRENSPTLDRIDNTKGYIKGNIRVISQKANTSKNNSTKEEYDLLTRNLRKIIDNMKTKQE